MIRIMDTYPQIPALFTGGIFQPNRWEAYINGIYPNSAHLFREGVDEYISSGKYTFEQDFLPVLNAVDQNPKLELLHESFCAAARQLDRRVIGAFGKELNVDVVLYLGLCNGAGWVTSVNGRDAVLLGVEKILELDWCDTDSMYGLIYHELGHVYHKQHGKLRLDQETDNGAESCIWQLFTEGIAMYFEQALVGDFRYYHQDRDGWAAWCEAHYLQIVTDFNRDLPAMSRWNQRYFGDWCDYCGRGDVGYYLGCRFVQELRKTHAFDELVGLTVEQVCGLYRTFIQQSKKAVDVDARQG